MCGESARPVEVSEGSTQGVIVVVVVVVDKVVGREIRRRVSRVTGQKLAKINVGPRPLTERHVSPAGE